MTIPFAVASNATQHEAFISSLTQTGLVGAVAVLIIAMTLVVWHYVGKSLVHSIVTMSENWKEASINGLEAARNCNEAARICHDTVRETRSIAEHLAKQHAT